MQPHARSKDTQCTLYEHKEELRYRTYTFQVPSKLPKPSLVECSTKKDADMALKHTTHSRALGRNMPTDCQDLIVFKAHTVPALLNQ